MQFDKNGDKRLSREELPQRMQSFFESADEDKDGFIDTKEAAVAQRRFQQRGDRSGGPGGAGPSGAVRAEAGGKL
jgi:collagen type III alpha